MAEVHNPQAREFQLTGFGVAATHASALTRHLSMRDRFARGARTFGLGLLAALIMLPIPIIHIVGPPIALLLGLVLGARRLGDGEIFVSAEGECPFCHTAQPLGLAGSRFRLPCDLICRSCRQPLQLDGRPASGGRHA